MSSLWEEALDGLNSKDKDDLMVVHDEKDAGPASIIRTVMERKEECVKKQWELYTNKQGEKIMVRDLLNKVSHWIDRFRQVGNSAVQFDPVHAAVPWAAVQLLLQVVFVQAKSTCK
jgi:hypothetical protein